MPSFAVVASLLSVAALARAQVARYPCSIVQNGAVVKQPNMCNALTGPGADTGPSANFKYDGYTPKGTVQCVLDPASSNYYCGYVGAACTVANSGRANSECDNGLCGGTGTMGVCQGYFTQGCGSNDFNCLGNIYCTDGDGNTTPSNTCGGIGAFCQDFNIGGLPTNAQNEANWNTLCQSSYCNFNTGNCDNHVAAGGDCSADPQFGCANGLSCVTGPTGSQTCQVTIANSMRARSRRNEVITKRSNLCPASYTACAVSTSKRAFECIDTSTNLEQCGACTSQGGVDCTSLPGVEAVGCVAGQCEIWACAEGFAWDASTESCAVALVV